MTDTATVYLLWSSPAYEPALDGVYAALAAAQADAEGATTWRVNDNSWDGGLGYPRHSWVAVNDDRHRWIEARKVRG